MTQIITEKGQRKYLTQVERDQFLSESRKMRIEVHTFCLLLLETGCRISEAMNVGREHIDIEQRCIYIESLKKRRKGTFRRLHVSNVTLVMLLRLSEIRHKGVLRQEGRLWNWSRMTAYRHVCAVMDRACIVGPHASPKGLRHGFAVAALQQGVPMNLVQRWLGHAHLNTTAIYADLMSEEERQFASLMWHADKKPEVSHDKVSAMAA